MDGGKKKSLKFCLFIIKGIDIDNVISDIIYLTSYAAGVAPNVWRWTSTLFTRI
jgi:hypothetical protein